MFSSSLSTKQNIIEINLQARINKEVCSLL